MSSAPHNRYSDTVDIVLIISIVSSVIVFGVLIAEALLATL